MTDRSPTRDAVDPRRRPLLVAGAVVATVGIGLLAWALQSGGDDDAPAAAVATTTPAAADALDDAFPDRPTPASTDPLPTPDPAGAPLAADAFEVTETSWVRSAFDELDFVLLTRNGAEVGFANVNLVAIFLDAQGAELERASFSYRLVGVGQTVALTGLRPIDPDAVAAIELEASARGSVPASNPVVEVTEHAWDQEETGTVTVTGAISASAPTEFVTVVAVLRDGEGAFIGTAFGFVDSVTTDSRVFEAVGFPSGDVSTIEVYVSG